MIKYLPISLVLCFVVTILLGLLVIPWLRKLKAGQPILKYVEAHKEKSGTPTMGGLFFIVPAMLFFLIFKSESSRLSTVAMTIGFSYMTVGFLDDFVKVKSRENEGLKAYQKILFQTAIAMAAGVFSYMNGLNTFNIPFSTKKVDLGYFTVVIVAFIFVAITNGVNLTDGLDGLAGNTSIAYLISLSVLILLQINVYFGINASSEELINLLLLCSCLVGSILGFLVFNTNKASVFMGDTGSLSLGGFIGAISIFSSNSLFIPILGIMFVLSCISVIIQVLHYKRTKKRVFKMAPLHHHFQLMGYSEQKIVYVYTSITLIVGTLLFLTYL